MTKKLMALMTGLFFMLTLANYASADDADVLRESQDRAAIEHLMWRYVRALDTLDEDAYAAVFTEDGQFGTGELVAGSLGAVTLIPRLNGRSLGTVTLIPRLNGAG